VLAVQLWLRRSFVTPSSGEPVVRDVVQVFKDVPQARTFDGSTAWADEIQYRDSRRPRPWNGSARSRLPAKPSAGYLAFMGKQRPTSSARRESAQILNYRDRFGEVMTMQVVPIGNGKRERATLDRANW